MKKLLALLPLLAFVTAGCGYALAGRASTMPEHIRRIGIPMLVNQSVTPDLDQILTNAIRQEVQSKRRYTVVPGDTGVDAVLTGTIMPVQTNLTGLTEARQAQRYIVTVSANVEFKDLKTNTIHWANANFRSSEEYEVPTGQGATDQTLVFQADRQALERLARTFARALVASIFEGM
jgi:hypothetical protein